MVFITVYTRCITISENTQTAGQRSMQKGPDAILVNSADVDELVEQAGVCLEIVKKNAFPQLIFENQ
jgi:hypothetical protein